MVLSKYASTAPFFLSTSSSFFLAKSNSFCNFNASWKSFSSCSVLSSMSREIPKLQMSLDVELDGTLESRLSASVLVMWLSVFLWLYLFFAKPVNKDNKKIYIASLGPTRSLQCLLSLAIFDTTPQLRPVLGIQKFPTRDAEPRALKLQYISSTPLFYVPDSKQQLVLQGPWPHSAFILKSKEL